MEYAKGTRKFLIATHGTLSAGLNSALEMIAGATAHICTLQAYVNNDTTLEEDISAVLAALNTFDELIIFTDIIGGSITNQLIQQTAGLNAHIVTGTNLPLLLEIILSDSDSPAADLIANAIDNAKNQILYVNKLLTEQAITND